MKTGSLPNIYRYRASYSRNRLIRAAVIVGQRNRCVSTGRVWNVLKTVRYSRFVFRVEAYEGSMPACRKATW